jgi:hypothetical protein
MYQEGKTLAAQVTTCTRLRYVFCRNENVNCSFWQIDTSVRVVPKPWIRHRVSGILVSYNDCTHVRDEKDSEYISECVW